MAATDPDPPIVPVWAVVAARMASERLPGKAVAPLAGRPALRHVIDRLAAVPSLDGIVVATTTDPADDEIERTARDAGAAVWRGSEADVLGRVLDAARAVGAATIVRVTGDCPLADPEIVERVVARFRDRRPDYASNRLRGYAFPIGMDVEVFPTRLLAQIAGEATDAREREHVTVFFYEHPERFDLLAVEPEPHERRPQLRLTLDTPEDLRVLSAVFDALYPSEPLFGLGAILDFLDDHPAVAGLNRDVVQKAP